MKIIIFASSTLAAIASASDLGSNASAGGCNVGSYKNKSCQDICDGYAENWWTEEHCVTNDDWFGWTCDTILPVDWSSVMLAEVEGKGPACACGNGKCCADTVYEETNARCFKDDGKTTCSAGSNMACCCYLLDSGQEAKKKDEGAGVNLRAVIN
eukprot:scaffold50014_cov66-Cyclotella_meneghiniana.AAC.8